MANLSKISTDDILREAKARLAARDAASHLDQTTAAIVAAAIAEAKEIVPESAPFFENLTVTKQDDLYLLDMRARFGTRALVGVPDPSGACSYVSKEILVRHIIRLADQMRVHICKTYGLEPAP